MLAALTDARLITVGDGEVELSHEALLREWPRYRGWLDEDRVGRRLHAHFGRGGGVGARGGTSATFTAGARLAAALECGAAASARAGPLEREFIAASRLEAEREARRQRSQNRRLRALLIGAGALLLVAIVAGSRRARRTAHRRAAMRGWPPPRHGRRSGDS